MDNASPWQTMARATQAEARDIVAELDIEGHWRRAGAVVNAFCSMVSDRAYRQGMPIGQALEILSASPAFDPAIVLALREIPAEDLRSALAGEDSPSRA